MRYVLATFNRDKVRELRQLFAPRRLELVSLFELPGASVPAESGRTLVENASIKARAAARLSGLPSIADDTGLEVDALDGEPGIRAARFAGITATPQENITLLLDRLKRVPPDRRTARFRTVCVACVPGQADVVAEGVLEGRIIAEPRGPNGFGYDPVFEVEGLGKTLAELDAAEKNRHSHRARAVMALSRLLWP